MPKEKNLRVSKKIIEKWIHNNRLSPPDVLCSIVLSKKEMTKLLNRALKGYKLNGKKLNERK